nr:hypothetical protein B0A51_17800 [Rachicladosporium sp. CCFEE 5018]
MPQKNTSLRLATQIELKNKLENADTTLERFYYTHLANPNLVGCHEHAERKHIANGLIFIGGRLSIGFIKQILKGYPGVIESNCGFHREHFMGYTGHEQRQTCTYLLRVLIEESGGADAWEEASKDDINNLLDVLFCQSAPIISKHTFACENHSVDFEGIWTSEKEDRLEARVEGAEPEQLSAPCQSHLLSPHQERREDQDAAPLEDTHYQGRLGGSRSRRRQRRAI